MRKSILYIGFVLAAAFVVVSCKDSDAPQSAVNTDEICFALAGDGFDMGIKTKADVVSSLSSVYWEAASSGSVVHAVNSYTVTSGKVSTGLYWPSEDATYSYKASNVSFETATGAITATNGTDIVAGVATGVTKSTAATINLDHIFARTGTVSLTPEDGSYTVSGVTWTIQSNDAKSGIAGTYTIGSGWGGTATSVLAQQALTDASDLYIIPASYTVGVSFTLSKGGYSENFTKSAALDFVGGKINNIEAKVSKNIGEAKEIEFTVNITAWDSTTHTPTFE